jgi:hypothetical protein
MDWERFIDIGTAVTLLPYWLQYDERTQQNIKKDDPTRFILCRMHTRHNRCGFTFVVFVAKSVTQRLLGRRIRRKKVSIGGCHFLTDFQSTSTLGTVVASSITDSCVSFS